MKSEVYVKLFGKRIVVLAMIVLLLESSFAQGPVRLPKLNKRTLLNGLNVMLIEHRETPKVTLSLMIKYGATFDPINKGGLADVTASMLKLGTTFRTSQQIANDINSMGASLNTIVDWDASYITISGSAQDVSKLLDILSDVMLNPVFPESEFNQLKQARLSEIRRERDNPVVLADEAFNKRLFGETAYAHTLRGTVESINAITLTNVKDFYKKFYVPNNAVLAIVGNVNAEATLKAVSRKLGTWVKSDLVPFTFVLPTSPSGIKITIIDRPESTQAEVRVGHIGISRENDDYLLVQVLSYILGVRSQSSSPEGTPPRPGIGNRFDARRMSGPFVAYTSAANNQAARAIQAIIDALRSIKGGVSEQELENAKRFLTERHMAQLKTPEGIAAQVLAVDLYQLGANYIDLYAARVQRMGQEDVKRAAERYLDPNNLVVVVVGRADELKRGLGEIGQVQINGKT